MATKQNTTRRGACETRRALITALGMALATPIDTKDAFDSLYARPSPPPKPQPWGESRRFISWLHPSGERAVMAAEAALASPDNCRGIVIGGDGVLRILLGGGIAVSTAGVEMV